MLHIFSSALRAIAWCRDMGMLLDALIGIIVGFALACFAAGGIAAGVAALLTRGQR